MMAESTTPEAPWPLNFRMNPLAAQTAVSVSGRPQFWTHDLYSGPDKRPVRILYGRSKVESEEIAQLFLGEPVLGFDMEWPWDGDKDNVPLQRRIGLIQVASEDKIGLFHVGLHPGRTPKDLLAPSLRKIIESPNISKTGVAILSADFARLRKYFDLTPRGAFELSHLHNLVVYGGRDVRKVTTRAKGLSAQVEEHLGFPLAKVKKVRQSNWSAPLNANQIKYAAADAYAGFMLYHCMNAKRIAMEPRPPLPIYAERYITLGKTTAIRLGTEGKNTDGISAMDFYGPPPVAEEPAHADEDNYSNHIEDGVEDSECDLEEDDDHAGAALCPDTDTPKHAFDEYVKVGQRGRQVLLERRATKEPQTAQEQQNFDAAEKIRGVQISGLVQDTNVTATTRRSPELTQILFERLRQHRKRIANEQGCAAFIIAHNSVLTALSEKCPRSESELLRIQGVRKKQVEVHGPAWIAIINGFIAEYGPTAVSVKQQTSLHAKTAAKIPSPRSRKRQPSPAVATVTGGRDTVPPVLHTGLSFNMQSTNLEEEQEEIILISSDEGDEQQSSPAFGTPVRSLSPNTLKRKRRELDAAFRSPSKQRNSRLHNDPQTSKLSTKPRTTSTPQHKKTLDAPLQGSPSGAASMTTAVSPTKTISQQSNQSSLLKTSHVPQDTRLSNGAMIFRKKLVALNKRVTPSIVIPPETMDHIVRDPPQTYQDLVRVPGIMPFANACAKQDKDLVEFIVKSTQS